MRDLIVLRFDAPLMSFGGVVVDKHGICREFPAHSMITGLIANALGWQHRDYERLDALQRALSIAARQDRPGARIVDFQTVDLGHPAMRDDRAWTTRGELERRESGSSEGTHIRYRHFLVDAVYTVGMTLEEGGGAPALDEIEAALRKPARPLFIGRKACLPAAPILLGRGNYPTLLDGVQKVPAIDSPRRVPRSQSVRAWWPENDGPSRLGDRIVAICDERDWANQIHVGRRYVREGLIQIDGEV